MTTGELIRAAVLALVLAASGLRAPEAHATTMAPLTIEQFTDASTYIVEGTVAEVWTELDVSTGMVWTKARVSVTDVLKGPDAPKEIVVWSAGGEYGDYSVWVPSSPVFSAQEDVFLFLDQSAGRLMPVSMFAGKYTVRRAPGDRDSYARLWEPTRLEKFDARFLPHPAVEDRLYVNDLRSQVEAHLAQPWDGKAVPGLSVQKAAEINTFDRRSR